MRTPQSTLQTAGPLTSTVGVDLVDVARMDRLLRREHAAERLLTAGEIAYCRARPAVAQHAAARFAAKEAVLKAFGTGLSGGLRWTDVEVINDPAGRPGVRLHGAAAALAARRGLASIEISLSHTADLAIAQAVALWSRRDRKRTRRTPMTSPSPAPAIRSLADAPADTRRGGVIQTLLSPRTVGSTSGFLGVATLAPGERIAEHYHPYSEEFLYVTTGTIVADLDGVPHVLHERDALLIPPYVRHRLRNAGDGEASAVFQLGPLAPRPELGHVDTESAPEA